ncbi:hypothetical protein GCM10010168_90080 [Actinoplanes ianthinogenes]|uniref:Uncharacterized protein n=1 Tax=Actinoplanes ianthinogenes TaxID=122358 RepID=A0ABM7M1Y3_9ACTN|nr:hypothetical protein [Actinoplanes ianthinogenes]BCJ45590.1 hypothetical protein Aiant_62470 [Actinoplanes ianthinogenes]GGR57140.1 hypothetical protein GCM10010168_90080 [Actinoplanes ianthinogenes]
MTDAPPFLVDVERSDGRVAVEVRAEGRRHSAVVERVHDPRLHPHIPIGTRERQHLRMTVDDLPVGLRPGPGRWSRHSYRVVAEHDGRQYVYRPLTAERSRLLRDGFPVGDFTVPDLGVLADWAGTPEPVDAAIGYALAAAFGAGAEFFLVAFLEHPAL